MSHLELCIASFCCRITWSDAYSSARFGHIVGSCLLIEDLRPPEELWCQATCKFKIPQLDHGSVFHCWHPCSYLTINCLAAGLASPRRWLGASTIGSFAGYWRLLQGGERHILAPWPLSHELMNCSTILLETDQLAASHRFCSLLLYLDLHDPVLLAFCQNSCP